MEQELLKITDLSVEYRVGGKVSKAVNHLNLTIHKGEALGLVGESGAGKTTTALATLGLLPEKVGYVTGGSVEFHGEPLLKKKDRELSKIRGKQIAMVFQNPLTSLNPLFTVGHQIAMVYQKHEKMSKKEAMEKADELLKMVGIASYRHGDYPHQFSGGMRQRVGIAAALACSPELLICDEPTTALDVTIQAQILELMKNLQSEYSTSLLMITHNLGIIAELCQNVAIMYAGHVVEYGSVEEVFSHPMHWYTKGLLNAIPKLTGPREKLESIPGMVANSQNLPEGCKFHPRCSHCTEQCKEAVPELVRINDNHYVACYHMEVGV
ncbi:MAG: ABC transporter ATP-binding protein [Lachnospiraceae bacterium]|nr:ABC transporter ATP-binding protein [Lachnospiraceae bacterium]